MHSEDAVDEETEDDVDIFITPTSPQNVSANDSGIVNGETDKE